MTPAIEKLLMKIELLENRLVSNFFFPVIMCLEKYQKNFKN